MRDWVVTSVEFLFETCEVLGVCRVRVSLSSDGVERTEYELIDGDR